MGNNRPEEQDTTGTEITVGEGRGEFYVYALSTTPVEAGFDLRNIFYVGKGKGGRWQQHFRDTVADLRRAGVDGTVTLSAKKQEIRKLIDAADGDLDIERHAYLVEWNLTEKEALRTEALVIKMMRSYGNVLTNEVAGHHESEVLMPAGEVRRFYAAEKKEVERIPHGEGALADFVPGGPRGDERVRVIVKGKSSDLGFHEDIVSGDVYDDGFLDARMGEQGVDARRAWDPRSPWGRDEARERARHYWALNSDNACRLRDIAEDGRLDLSLAVEDPRGQTVIRYTWAVDGAGGDWLWYPAPRKGQQNKVGFPLGHEYGEPEDPWLGKCLVTDGLQVLVNRPVGICFVVAEEDA